MNEYQIKTRFPRASKTFVELNSELPHPIAQPLSKDALDKKARRKVSSEERFTVRITSYRIRLLDSDNAYGGQKPLLDAITELGLIHDDNPEAIELIVCQKKVQHRNQEKTLIEIYN